MFIIVISTDPSSAAKKPSTVKPSTNEATNQKRKALITKENSPRVRIVIGRVRINKTGRTTALRIPRMNTEIVAM